MARASVCGVPRNCYFVGTGLVPTVCFRGTASKGTATQNKSKYSFCSQAVTSASPPVSAVIATKVDFKKQIVLVFAWRGSGGDKLEYQILESFPEQIPFSLRPGVTDDLRSHSRVFALRSNVKWSVKAPK